MKWSPAAALLAALLVAGCGGGSSATNGQLVRAHGVLVRVGGPPPGAPVALRGVVVRFQGDGESAVVRTDRHGRFAFAIPPGTYRVSITAGGPQTENGSIQPVPRLVHLPRSRPLRLVVNIM